MVKKVNDRYNVPLLFKNDKLITPILPPITDINDLYPNTYNKYSLDYGKRLKTKIFFMNLCTASGWTYCEKNKTKKEKC